MREQRAANAGSLASTNTDRGELSVRPSVTRNSDVSSTAGAPVNCRSQAQLLRWQRVREQQRADTSSNMQTGGALHLIPTSGDVTGSSSGRTNDAGA